MKRGGPLRRTPLARCSSRLRRSPLARGKRLSPRSKRREEEASDRLTIRERVFARDRYACRLLGQGGAGRCFGGLTPHHVLKASQGGGYTESNLVTLCSSHNDRLEADADLAALARSLGLVKLREDR